MIRAPKLKPTSVSGLSPGSWSMSQASWHPAGPVRAAFTRTSRSNPPARSDGEVAEADLETVTYTNDTIELAQLIRDEIFLAMPMVIDCTLSTSGQCADYDTKLEVAPPAAEPSGRLFEALKNVKLAPKD